MRVETRFCDVSPLFDDFDIVQSSESGVEQRQHNRDCTSALLDADFLHK